MMKKVLFLFLVILLFSCNQSKQFTITGIINNAENKTLYIERNGIGGDSLIDSVKLDKKGAFKFKTHSPKYPDLYKLRIGNQYILLGVDSTETITIKADAEDLLNTVFDHSENSKAIQELRNSVVKLQTEADEIIKQTDAVKKKTMIDSLNADIKKHKQKVIGQILLNPQSIVSYFGLYQQVAGTYIMSPFDKEDRRYFQSVATSYDTFMPDYERSKNLKNLVLDALKSSKEAEQLKNWEKIQETSAVGFIDIELKDKNNIPKKLSDLEGKVIVLDFSAAEMDGFVDYVFELRDIYNTYSSTGLQIYQISLDQNKMLWEQAAANLPWICVRHENGYNNPYVGYYNVKSIPTLFLINRAGNIVGRFDDPFSLKKAIKNLK